MLVEMPGRKGIGKLESAADGRCVVSVFHSVLRTERLIVGLDEISRGYLSPQTRVYVRDGEGFQVGRVTDYLEHENGLLDYEVRFPNGRQRDVGELELFVRPWNAPEDPAEILATGGAESQYLHDRRQAALSPLLSLRSAAQGLTSLISAGVDFVPHQIAAVRRVLTDPIQRYLLADEVGLGKTIEAGLIIRQHLIDNGATRVLITVPPHLCDQWRSEMFNKLRLDQFGEAFECCSHSDLSRVTRKPDVLVVDEAHHLVGVDSGPLLGSAKKLRSLARDAPVLLLLSATPALGEEAKFLELLNLLDPITHPLDDLAGFRAKLEKRRDIGRMLLSLDHEAPGLVLRSRCAELQRSFPDDLVVQELAPRLVTATREGPDEVPDLCSALKEHIADSYRIHQRLIRSRRADAKGWEFMPRGPAVGGDQSLVHVRTEADTDEQIDPLLAAIEDWRFSASESASGDYSGLTSLATRYAGLLSAASIGTEALKGWLGTTTPGFGGEGEILDAIRSIVDLRSDEQRIRTMAESTNRLLKTLRADTSHPKIVVFASSSEMASMFHERYVPESDGTIVLLLTERVGLGSAEVLAAFKEPRRIAVLVTDRSGEEGLNLNLADAIIHLDLPLSAARLEQRIGRLDRFGRRQGIIRHRILLPSDNEMSPWAAWFDFLAQGFEIFNRSISDIQFLLEDFEAQAFRTLLEVGPSGLVRLSADVRVRIAEERKSQDEQYALDRIADGEDPVEAFIQRLEDSEEDEDALERGVDRWLVEALQLKKRPFAWPAEDPFKLDVTKQTLIPRLPWQAELGIDHAQALTWKRRIATKRSDAVLLRPGTPLIDVAERFTRWDDRGTAFVTYRTVPDWGGDVWIGFKLCFIIEPGLEPADLLTPTRAELAAARRSQRYFAPRGHILYIDVNGDPVSDAGLIAILERPYDSEHKGGQSADLNIGSRPQLLAEIIEFSTFQQVCRSVRDGARGWLASQKALVEQIAAGALLAEADINRRRSRLLRRESAGDAMAHNELGLIESILPSIREPTIRLDAMGCFIVAQNALRGRADG
ncbi:MAG: protein DpdE [Devosia sp.]